MALQTRVNPETGVLEVLAGEQWVRFDEFRKQQIDQAYQNSIQFLRDRLGEDAAREMARKESEERES
ncbi:MAG: hypothetical protein JNJ50_07925 [Acidobacteria bacterium]|nr:hypothetical protein [Acidobacteriota bacterium]